MAREITYYNFEISVVVFMPNVTTNHAITYTNTLTGATQKKVTNQITEKYQYIPKKLVVGQSAARKKTISYLKRNIFKKANCFTRQCFSIRNFTYNTLETYICLTWAVIFLSTSSFLTTMLCTIAALCNNMQLQFKKFITNVYVFRLHYSL